MATKVSALVDDNGVPFSILCHPANQSDMRLLQPTLDSTIVALPGRIPLYADKGYDSAFNLSPEGIVIAYFAAGAQTAVVPMRKEGSSSASSLG